MKIFTLADETDSYISKLYREARDIKEPEEKRKIMAEIYSCHLRLITIEDNLAHVSKNEKGEVSH